MRILTEEMIKRQNDPNSVYYKIAHTPKPDFTEADKELEEFLKEIRAEHEKERRMIREVRKNEA